MAIFNFSLVGFKGNLSLLDILVFLQGLKQMEDNHSDGIPVVTQSRPLLTTHRPDSGGTSQAGLGLHVPNFSKS